MKNSAKAFLPILLALLAVSFLSYKIFVEYKPVTPSLVKEGTIQGTAVSRNGDMYLDSVPLPLEAERIGVSASDVNEQVTAKSKNAPEYIHRFYKSALTVKGWTIKSDLSESAGEISYKRTGEELLVNVLSLDAEETIFSLTYSRK